MHLPTHATHGIFAICAVLVYLAFPSDAAAEHCAGANYVDGLEPSAPELWKIGKSRSLSWQLGSSCGFLTYRVEISRNGGPYELVGVTEALLLDGRFEYPWRVTGPGSSDVLFRVARVVPDRVLPYAYTAPIQVRVAVATRTSSWAALRARF
jgi:hypothetical protein